MARAGDGEREGAAERLREHYVHGRLTLEEFDDRAGSVLGARSTGDLRRAFRGLPSSPSQTFTQLLLRGAALLVLTGAWLVFSFVLLGVLAVTFLIQGATLTAPAVLLVVWLVPTLLLSRLWRRTWTGRASRA